MSVSDEQDLGDFDPEAWDPDTVRSYLGKLRPLLKQWFRAEVRGLDRVPPAGGALIVSNHSGGPWAFDAPLFSLDYCERFGYDRPIYTLSHDVLLTLMKGQFGQLLKHTGTLRANRANAVKALNSGALVVVFPGGDHDVFRPTRAQNVIDFNHRTGYVKSAVEAEVPIVPMVTIGAQENQLYLSRGRWLAKALGLKRLLRWEVLPISIGFPFGLTVFLPFNLPLPTKIVVEVLEPIDIIAKFGRDPDIAEVDAHVRSVMQSALGLLAAERQLPVLG